jgi:transposase-like protein
MQSPLPDPSEVIRSGSDGRLRFTPEQRDSILVAFDRCGVSAMAFARQHGLKYQTFISWLRKRREGRELQGETFLGSVPAL